jgi:phospho-acceptor domain-containing protein
MSWIEKFAAAAFSRAADVAHDLKTPLNVGVLNLELLRMRMQKLTGRPDEKINDYTRGIDGELRRLALIFDAYFVYSVPPKDEESIQSVPMAGVLGKAQWPSQWNLQGQAAADVFAHPSRIRDLLGLLIEGGAKIFSPPSVVVTPRSNEATYHLRVEGAPSIAETDFGKLFKFYYTDTSGNPELALATARLIAETYGGSLTLWDENNGSRLVLELQLPLAARANES